MQYLCCIECPELLQGQNVLVTKLNRVVQRLDILQGRRAYKFSVRPTEIVLHPLNTGGYAHSLQEKTVRGGCIENWQEQTCVSIKGTTVLAAIGPGAKSRFWQFALAGPRAPKGSRAASACVACTPFRTFAPGSFSSPSSDLGRSMLRLLRPFSFCSLAEVAQACSKLPL